MASSLRGDEALRRRPIDVDMIADGVVELSGSVRDRSEAERAVTMAQRTAGIYTVVNRLEVSAEESHRARTAARREDGAPELNTRGHSGMGVGMEARRQSPATDPDRPSDKQPMLERELEVGNVEDRPEGGPDPVSGAEAVDDNYFKPGDERAIREAGLDPEKERTSAPRESTAGDAAGPGGETSDESTDQAAAETTTEGASETDDEVVEEPDRS